jgi:hypothetical protein
MLAGAYVAAGITPGAFDVLPATYTVSSSCITVVEATLTTSRAPDTQQNMSRCVVAKGCVATACGMRGGVRAREVLPATFRAAFE